MYLKILKTLGLLLLASLLTACAGSKRVKVQKGSLPAAPPEQSDGAITTSAEIVHVDLIERLATIEHAGKKYGDISYVQAVTPSGNQSGVLIPILDSRSEFLINAEIIDGTPAVNDRIIIPGPSKLAEFEKMYGEVDPETL